MTDVNQTPNEKIEAVHNLKGRLEQDFVELGQLLSEIKDQKLFRYKGYDSFRDFVQAEFGLNYQLCNKLIRVYDLFFNRLDMSEDEVKRYGFEKLSIIAPVLDKADAETRDQWLDAADELSVGELQDQIKGLNKKNKQLSVKEVLVEQFTEQMCSTFNCSKKEMMYKLALYFIDQPMDIVRDMVKIAQRKFEQEIALATDAGRTLAKEVSNG